MGVQAACLREPRITLADVENEEEDARTEVLPRSAACYTGEVTLVRFFPTPPAPPERTPLPAAHERPTLLPIPDRAPLPAPTQPPPRATDATFIVRPKTSARRAVLSIASVTAVALFVLLGLTRWARAKEVSPAPMRAGNTAQPVSTPPAVDRPSPPSEQVAAPASVPAPPPTGATPRPPPQGRQRPRSAVRPSRRGPAV
jgi:hypothetical protein